MSGVLPFVLQQGSGAPLTGGLQPIHFAWIWDNKKLAIAGAAPNNYFLTNYFAYTEYQVNGPQTFGVEAVVATNALAAVRNSVDVIIDGVYFTTLVFTVENQKQLQTFVVPAGSHTLQIVAGQETYVTAVQGSGTIMLPAPVAKREVLCGASGTYGFNSLGMFAAFSWYGQFRLTGRFGGGYNLSQSGFGLYNWIGAGVANFVNVTVGGAIDGTAENDLFLETVAGTYESNQSTPAQFGIDLAATLDLLHATYPTLRIWVQDPIFLNNGNAPNAGGFTLTQYTTQQQTVCAARAWVNEINGLLMGTTAADLCPDNLHEIQGVASPAPGTGYAKAFRVVRQTMAGQVQIPSVASAATTLQVTGGATWKTIIGASTYAFWRSDAGITIGTTPRQTGVGGAVTWAGTRLRQDVPFLKISTAGTGPAALFDLYVDGGTTPIQTGISCAATVSILNATNAPMVVSFPNVAYALNTTYQATVESWADSAGNGWTMTAPAIVNQPLLVAGVINGQRGVKGDGVNSVMKSNLSLPKTAVTSTFISGVVRIDTWTNGNRLYGCEGGNSILCFMNSATPKVSAFAGTITPAAGSAGMVVGSFKRIDTYFSGSVNDYMHAGSVATTGSSFGATGAAATSFNLFETIAGSFRGAATFVELGLSAGDPGVTIRGNLDTYFSNRYAASVLT